MIMGTYVNKRRSDALKVAFVVALVLSATMAEAAGKGRRGRDRRPQPQPLPQPQTQPQTPPENGDFKVGMPLYRVKAKPGVLIPEFQIPPAKRNASQNATNDTTAPAPLGGTVP